MANQDFENNAKLGSDAAEEGKAYLKAVVNASAANPLENYYEILGVPEDADINQIDGRFLDHSDDRALRGLGAEKKYVEAYETLTDPVRRAAYDRKLALMRPVVAANPADPSQASVEDNSLQGRAKSLLKAQQERDKWWSDIFAKLNGGNAIEGTRKFHLETVQQFKQADREALDAKNHAQSMFKAARGFTRSFVRESRRVAAAVGTNETLDSMYNRDNALVQSIKADANPYMQQTRSKLLNDVEIMIREGKHDDAMKSLNKAEPGRLTNLWMTVTFQTGKLDAVREDLKRLRTSVQQHQTLTGTIKKMEIETDKSIRKVLDGWNLKGLDKRGKDTLLTNPKLLEMAEKDPALAFLLEHMQAGKDSALSKMTGGRMRDSMNRFEIRDAVRAGRGEITLDKLAAAMRLVETEVALPQVMEARKASKEATRAYIDIKNFAKHALRVANTERHTIVDKRRVKNQIGLTGVLEDIADGKISDAEAEKILAKIEKTQQKWTPAADLPTATSQLDKILMTPLYTADAGTLKATALTRMTHAVRVGAEYHATQGLIRGAELANTSWDNAGKLISKAMQSSKTRAGESASAQAPIDRSKEPSLNPV